MEIPRTYEEVCKLKTDEILKLADNVEVMGILSNRNISVAHEQASRGFEFKNPEVLKISTNVNWSVAHTMASAGHVFHDPDILKLTDSNGCTVADVMNQYIHRSNVS